MDDQGAGGSLRGRGTSPHERPMGESSLPPTLLQHLYPPGASSPRIAPLIAPDLPNWPTSPRSHDHGRSLPPPSHLLRQVDSAFDYDRVILSRSLDASPINPVTATTPNLPPARLASERPPPLDNRPTRSARDRSTGGHPPVARTMSTSPHEPQSLSYSHVLQYGRGRTPRIPGLPQPPPRQAPSPGIQDVFMGDVGVLPQPEVPVRPPRESYPELRHSPGSAQGQGGSRSEARANHNPRVQHLRIQADDHRVTHGQSGGEKSQRDPQRQAQPAPSQLIRERRPPTAHLSNPFEEQQRLQRLPPQQQQRVHHQPQPQQPTRFSQLLNGPGYQKDAGASSSSQSVSSSRDRTIPTFLGELYPDEQSEIKPSHRGSSIAGPPAIETQEAVPEQKRPRPPAVEGALEGGSAGAGHGPITPPPSKEKKVSVACDFCRGRKLRCDGNKPACSNCSVRGTQCAYQPGGPRRRGPGKAPKKTRAEASRQRQQQRRTQKRPAFDQSQMSISAGAPGSSVPLSLTIVSTSGIAGGGGLLHPGTRMTASPRFPSPSPGASTPEVETGSHTGRRRRRLSESSVEEPARKRFRMREFEGEGGP